MFVKTAVELSAQREGSHMVVEDFSLPYPRDVAGLPIPEGTSRSRSRSNGASMSQLTDNDMPMVATTYPANHAIEVGAVGAAR